MSDPFQLSGGAFLFFYSALALAVSLGLRFWFRHSESGGESVVPKLTDPYLIAYLRGGEKEALRIATVSLIDRGLLVAGDDTVVIDKWDGVELAARPIEKAILTFYRNAGKAVDVFTDAAALRACEEYRRVLLRYQLIPDMQIYARRLLPALAALAFLWGVAGYKIFLALSQNRSNVMLLFFFMVAAAFGMVTAFYHRRTGRGEQTLADLKQLFYRLKNRARTVTTGGKTNEAALLAAIFGLGALSSSDFEHIKKLYPKRDDSSGGCGSSCGGGGGGGGCGGGCGGCGG